jgi:chemotaxis protein MotB
MARKKKHEEHENHERWLISYADFITLLFAFFVVMYSVSSVNEGKYRVLSDSLVAAFRSSARSIEPIQVGELSKSSKQPGLVKGLVDQGGDLAKYHEKKMSPFDGGKVPISRKDGGTSVGEESGEGRKGGAEAIKKMADELEKAMSNLIQQDLIAVRRNDLWVEVEIKTSILFSSGSAQLQQEALPVLSEIARILKDFPNPIRVEGFTDSVPINTLAFPSNWELSAGRSASVVHLFTKEGVEPRRMASIGYGEYRPIADNATAEGRNMNRRIVIVILESASAERVFSGKDKLTSNNITQESGTPGEVPMSIGNQGALKPADVQAK